ncbi:glycoside hydrolase family 28 protein [Telmatospirillum sp.]|uniref:glycoside hydrolase family 28 protein n=1 Tax=Telmatospirillum sp. TaxID=2079197 RepID=UPI002846FE72|nr:glycoside hydrolase family 28 protein [Telmatospirillum sp.]MDR3435921.1 glycoside hydrolase family 28 protein [Telmatospirillum sp.]
MAFGTSFKLTRRSLLASGAAGAGVFALGFDGKAVMASSDPWTQATAIANRLASPVSFPARDFYVTAYGAATCPLTGAAVAWTNTTTQAAAGTILTPASGSTDCYPAFAAAIAACHAAGGGRVIVPAGNWYCAGPITLLSNVNFHLASGAQIYFDPNPANYAKYGSRDCGTNGKLVFSRWQGNECWNYSPPVYAYGQSNIALTGEGTTSTLNCQANVTWDDAQCWWTWKGKTGTAGWKTGNMGQNTPNPLNLPLLTVNPSLDPALAALIQGTGTAYTQDALYLPALSEASVPVSQRIFGVGHALQPCAIEFYNCTNVLMDGYQVTNTPFWQHHPTNCRNVVMRNVTANSHGPNNDGIDVECCNYVLLEGCTFDTGDDCVAIEAGKDLDNGVACQNVVVQNCIMQSGHGGMTLGSEMAGGVQNVYAQNLTMRNANWATDSLRIAVRLKTNLNRGGYLKNFYVRNISLPNGISTTPSYYTPLTGSPIAKNSVTTNQGGVVTFDCDYSPSADNVRTRPPVVQNVSIENITVGIPTGQTAGCYQAIIMQGPVAYDYNGPAPTPAVPPVTGVTISNCNFGTPANAANPIYLYNTQGLVLTNVTIAGKIYNTTLSA